MAVNKPYKQFAKEYHARVLKMRKLAKMAKKNKEAVCYA